MSTNNEQNNQPSNQSEEGPSSLIIGVGMIVGIGALMLIGYMFR